MLTELRAAVLKSEAKLVGIPSEASLEESRALLARLETLTLQQAELEAELAENPAAAMHVFGKQASPPGRKGGRWC